MNYRVETPSSWISFSRSSVTVAGWFLDAQGRAARQIRLRLGSRVIACIPGRTPHDFIATFRTKPGLKHLVIEAETEDGDHRVIGRRLVCVYARERAATKHALWVDENARANPPRPPPAKGPLISVLMPVHNTPERWLRRAIDSVREQTYAHWELCIADDASTAAHVRRILKDYASRDARIKIIRRPVNGHISAASNSALELAAGEFTALLDHDDELAPHALAEVARALEGRPAAQIIYSDEDKIDPHGQCSSPYFKPEWNPDLLLAQNYFAHLAVYRTSLIRELGGFRIGCEGAQDWDLALRTTSHVPANAILHIPQILYHWRAIPGSTARKQSHKSYAIAAARQVLRDHLARSGIEAEVLPVRGGHWRVRRKLPATPPRVSLIIPTRNRVSLLRTCVESILESTRYPDFEILVIDNGSDDPATLAYLENLGNRGVKILRDDGPFNYSALNNRAVAHATGEVLGFLNNDLKLITPDWLEEMVSHAIRPEVGAVGAMLYFPDDRVQHAGVVLGLAGPKLVEGVAGHAFKFFPRGHTGMRNRLRVAQNYSAVTAACLLVRREVFLQAGGFDEEHLAVAYNDVDFCLRLGAAGYRNVWTPFAEFYHYESASRGADDTPAKKAIHERECAYMRRTWGPLLDNDPAYNPNLTLVTEDFAAACRTAPRFDSQPPPTACEFTRIPEHPAAHPGPRMLGS
ncbi:MAG: glycosyltransferase family 2 protein [Verrucomicrobia bacterium]|nr:glycosyltransferase family 2 protein [Verrucomicrobiota bacterium]